jgi:hypothetical protein
MKKTSCLLLLSLLLSLTPLSAATITVPSLELYTRGSSSSGGLGFGFESRGEIDLLLEGGAKFGGTFGLSFRDSLLEDAIPGSDSGLFFKTASVTVRQLFSLPLDLTYFIGYNDTFGSGEDYSYRFNTLPAATRYRGYLHFPDGVEYDGLHQLNGTGLQLDYAGKKERAFLSLYTYQDALIDSDDDPITPLVFETGYYSADFRALLRFQDVILEAFAGGTYPAPASADFYCRGGLLFYAANKGVEFLTQLGVPRWAPLPEQLEIDHFYLLVEPRVHAGPVSIIPTFFWRPAYYLQQATLEKSFDMNLDLRLGRMESSKVLGGLESNLVYMIEEDGVDVSEPRAKVTPYLQFLTSGAVWEIRVDANVWPFALDDLIECFLTVKAEF